MYMLKNLFLKFGAWVGVLPVLLMPNFALAEVKGGGLKGSADSLTAIGTAAGQNTGAGSDLPKLIGSIISVLLGVLGIIFVILIIYAGINYMTASGDADKVKKSKTMLIQAVIGIIIIVAAYSIAQFVIQQITAAATAA